MKSLFKRTLATATGSVLALSQLVSVAATVNVSAAETLVVDKAFVLNVPIDELNPLKADQVSDWADEAEAKFIELGDGHTFKVGTQKAKDRARTFLAKNGSAYLTAEDIEALLATVDAQGTVVTNTNGTFTGTAGFGDIGPIIGGIVERLYGDKIVELDWSEFHASAQATVSGKVDFDAKTVTYETAITASNGKTYQNFSGAKQYAFDVLEEATQYAISKGGLKTTITDTHDQTVKKLGYVSAIADAINAITLSGETDPDTAYSDYLAAVDTAIDGSGVPAAVADRVKNAIDKREPASVTSAIESERFNSLFDRIVNVVNSSKANAQVDLTTSDIAAVINDGYDYEINVPNGYSADAAFKYEDEQAADLLDAVKSVYTDDGFIAGADLEALANAAGGENQDYIVVDGTGAEVTDFTKDYTVIEVVSHKEISAYANTDYVVKGELFYDVERVIEQIVVEEVEETTTTTTTTTDTTSTTTTSTTSDSTSTTTSSTTTDSTTTTTDTTSSTDSTSSTTTTLATYVSFDVGANGNNELVYWSEETDATFDFDTITIKAHFIVAGEDQAEDVVDVTEFFGAEANSPAEMGISLAEGIGSGKFPVGLILKDEAGLAQVIDEKGYDSESIIADQSFANGAIVSRFYVILVLRGDADLNGEISVEDAQYALNYYTDVLAKHGPAHTIRAGYYLIGYNDPMAIMPYSHYAMDTADGDGVINIEDAQRILQYYTDNTLAQKNYDWDKVNEGVHVIPLNQLHADPLAQDDFGKADYVDYMATRE
ncbi:MAG: hypothetical protein IJ060_05800 [Oscillospiraceae bacterium]|nr:hypothetical protein [Oscillospiraceae bacterium]